MKRTITLRNPFEKHVIKEAPPVHFSATRNSQGVPVCITCNSEELEILFVKDYKAFNICNIPPEGKAIVYGDSFEIILFRMANKVVLLKVNKRKDRRIDFYDDATEKIWCYDYEFITIDTSGRIPSLYENLWDWFDINQLKSDNDIRSFYPRGYSNVCPYRTNTGVPEGLPVIVVKSLKIVLYFTVKRCDYEKKVEESIKRLFYLKHLLGVHYIPMDVYHLILCEYRWVWRKIVNQVRLF